jgi:hypothetical protein
MHVLPLVFVAAFLVVWVCTLVWIVRVNPPRTAPSPVFVVLGLWMLYMAGETVTGRLLIETDGIVVTREPVNNPRPGTYYTMRAADGHTYQFASGATDSSLSRDFAVGSHVTKHKWDLGYTLDGRRVDSFPTIFYSGLVVVALCSLYYGALYYIRRRRPNHAMERMADRRTLHI